MEKTPLPNLNDLTDEFLRHEDYREETDEEVFQFYMNDLDLSPEDFNKKILDVGSGSAQFAKWAEEHNLSKDIYSIDPKGNFSEKKRSAVADARQIPFPDNTFDLVISNGSMPHILLDGEPDVVRADVQKVFNELLRVSKDNGEIRLGSVILGGKEKRQIIIDSVIQEELEKIKENLKAKVSIIKKSDIHRYEGHQPVEVIAGKYLIVIKRDV